jgi:hypothetical protein
MRIGLIDNDMCTRKTHNFPNLAFLFKNSNMNKTDFAKIEFINWIVENGYQYWKTTEGEILWYDNQNNRFTSEQLLTVYKDEVN